MGIAMQQQDRRIVCMALESVLHRSESAGSLSYDVLPGFFEWADAASQHYALYIHSPRSKESILRDAMRAWMRAQRQKWRDAGGRSASFAPARFEFPETEPQAVVYIGPRELRFGDDWGAVETDALLDFAPWSRRQVHTDVDGALVDDFLSTIRPSAAPRSTVHG